MEKSLINDAAQFVKSKLKKADESGHDWNHTFRVWQLTKNIAQQTRCKMEVAELGALFHDIADAKFHDGDELVGEKITHNWLRNNTKDINLIEKVVFIVNYVSYRKKYRPNIDTQTELAIVQDADRLDAMGAIGIARAFSFGGFKNRPLYSYSENNSENTIAHFHEKLLHLKDLMNTPAAKLLAKERHDFMILYLDHFQKEINTTI